MDRMRTALIVQLLLIAALGAVLLALEGAAEAVAALYGGSIALLNLLLLAWRVRRTERGPVLSAQQSARALYLSALERFAAVAVMFMVGMGVLRLDPLPLIVGFVVALPALLLQGIGRRE